MDGQRQIELAWLRRIRHTQFALLLGKLKIITYIDGFEWYTQSKDA